MNDYYGDKTQYNNILRYLSQPKNFKKGKFIAIDSQWEQENHFFVIN